MIILPGIFAYLMMANMPVGPILRLYHLCFKGRYVGRIKKAGLAAGTSIARVSASVLALPMNKKKSTAKSTVKDIKLPRSASAADVSELLAARARQISETIYKEEQAIARILEDTASKISHGPKPRR